MQVAEIPYQALLVPEMQSNQEPIIRNPQQTCKYGKFAFQHFPFIATTIALNTYIATILGDNLTIIGYVLSRKA